MKGVAWTGRLCWGENRAIVSIVSGEERSDLLVTVTVEEEE